MSNELIKEIMACLASKDINLKEVSFFASGGQKDVYKVSINNRQVLMKIVYCFLKDPSDYRNMSSEERIEVENIVLLRLKREIEMMRKCDDRLPKIEITEDYIVFQKNRKKYAIYFEELIKGETLDTTMKKREYSIDDLLNFFEKMIKNIESLDRNDCVHRDIKPKNIIETPTSDYILIDLGVGKISCESEKLTRSYWSPGTEKYYSPEQRRGVPSSYKWDFRNDLYAIGLVATELYLPEFRIRDNTKNIDLMKLKLKWQEKAKNKVEKDFFDCILVYLLKEEKFARFPTVDSMRKAFKLVGKGGK